jgi:hypothetical protein
MSYSRCPNVKPASPPPMTMTLRPAKGWVLDEVDAEVMIELDSEAKVDVELVVGAIASFRLAPGWFRIVG